MADTTTEHYEFTKPEIGGSADTWGLKLNENFDGIDTALNAVSVVANGAAAKSENLHDLANAATARGNLGLAIGSDVQAYHANLTALSNVTLAPNTMIYTPAAGPPSVCTFTPFALSLVSEGTAGSARDRLGLGALATQSSAAVANGGTGASDAAGARGNLGLAIGSNVQAYSATLSSLAGASATGVSLVTAADYAAMRALLAFSASDVGLGSVENKSSATIRGEISSSNVTTALGFTPQAALGYTPMNAASYGNVENKSSATIRGELTQANLDAAAGSRTARVASGSAANSGLISWGTGDPGALALGEIWLKHA